MVMEPKEGCKHFIIEKEPDDCYSPGKEAEFETIEEFGNRVKDFFRYGNWREVMPTRACTALNCFSYDHFYCRRVDVQRSRMGGGT